jgi:hypothetical protein
MKRLVKRLSLASLLSIALTLVQPFAFAPSATASESTIFLSGSWNIYTDGEDVSISWDLGEVADTTLLIDGAVATHGSGSGHLFLKDAALTPQTLDVSLRASKPIDQTTAQYLANRDETSIQKANETYFHLTTSRIPFHLRPSTITGDSATAAIAQPAISILRYQTFIPTAYEDQTETVPRLFCTPDPLKTYAFNGNDRSFDPLSTSFKTRMDTWVYWEQGGALLSNTSVGVTELFEKVGTAYSFVASRRASDSTMAIQTISQSNSSVKFKMSQNVMNPFCNPQGWQGIQFDFEVQIWRTGKYMLDGWAIRVPSHEAYLKESDSPNWFPILKSGFTTFECLKPFYKDLLPALCLNQYSLANQKN